jgi:hypothetical protein
VTRTHVLAALLAAGTLAVTAAPAGAAQLKVKDARGDVWGEADAVNATPSPTISEGDISNAVVAYQRDAVTVKVRFVKLSRTGPYAQYAVRLQGSKGVVREVLVESSRRDRSGVHRVFNGQGGEVGDCDAQHRIDYKRDVVKVKVDRGCLSRSGKVRANVNTAHATGTGVFYSDNVHDTAAQSAAWTDWVKRAR